MCSAGGDAGVEGTGTGTAWAKAVGPRLERRARGWGAMGSRSAAWPGRAAGGRWRRAGPVAEGGG